MTHSATWPTELPRSLDYPPVAVGAIAAGAAVRFGDRVAFRHHDAELTYRELWARACRFANALAAHGVGRGDTVALHLPNCLAYPVAYYGTLLSGATFSPTNPLLPPDDLAFQLTDCGAVAVVSGSAAPALAAVLERTGVRLAILTEPADGLGDRAVAFEDFLAAAEDTRPDTVVHPDTDLAHVAYTGGTTGRSKGVRIPHRNVVVNSLQSSCWSYGALPALDDAGGLRIEQVGDRQDWPLQVGTGRVINLTPWFHAMGIIGSLNASLLGGATMTLHDRFDPAAYLAEAERLRITHLGGAPALYAALLACPDLATRDLSEVCLLSSGAAPLPVEMIRALRARFPEASIGEGYGLTEVTMVATGNPTFRAGLRKIGSVGVPLFDTEVKIVAAEGGEDALPAGTQGEVCIRGPQVMTGYHNRPEATAAVLVDGWLHTGDIGSLDEDGYLSIVDRKKDMLLYKGYNVYPRELEELLIAHPSVAACAVVGRPDPATGELPTAFVVATPDGPPVTAADLIAVVNEKVLPYKRIRELHFVDRIPVSAAGKILKRQLRQEWFGAP